MIQITGKVFDIHEISDKEAQIVIRKKNGDKIVPVAINVFGFFYEKIKSQGLRQGDKIRGRVFLKSKFWDKGKKYFTDVYFKEIQILEKSNLIQYSTKIKRIDTETGEIFE